MPVKVKRALISVSNKKGIIEFARTLDDLGAEIISTGGTYNVLREAGLKVIKVEDVTGFSQMLGGRVKTLHPYIHAAILADRSNPAHMESIFKAGIKPIDMVVVNLYPFKETVSRDGVSLEEAIENIDIGGPTMIRSAGKNYRGVAVVVDAEDYEKISKELLENDGVICDDTLFRLAVKAFQHTCEYDSVVFNYFIRKLDDYGNSPIYIRPYLDIYMESVNVRNAKEDTVGKVEGKKNVFKDAEGKFSDTLSLEFVKKQDLRYGENPHQKASYYEFAGARREAFVNSEKLQGKELSYNNILDANAAFCIVREFDAPCVVIVKHNNPCGASVSSSVRSAYENAYQCDPVSAFGGIVACNVKWTKEATLFMMDKYVEVLVAPDFEEDALELLAQKQNLRVLKVNFNLESFLERIRCGVHESSGIDFNIDLKSVDGGILVQDLDIGIDGREEMKVVTNTEPSCEQWEDLLFGWQIVKGVKSNAIVLVSGRKTVGIGAGQMSRVDAVRIAIEKAGDRCLGSVLASDAFFPFEDAVKLAYESGVKAIIQPGGSVRDAHVIDFCNEKKIPMVFTGKRHFRH